MRILAASFALLALAALVAPVVPVAAADPSATPDVKTMAQNDCARARAQNKTCVLDMGKEDIDGAAPTHDDVNIAIIKFGRAASLIHLRKDFIQEILRTAEDVE